MYSMVHTISPVIAQRMYSQDIGIRLIQQVMVGETVNRGAAKPTSRLGTRYME
jgi:hypothetical protein